MQRVLLRCAAAFAAILFQVSVLANLPFPGGTAPDLVLVMVVTLALTSSPLEGAVLGFAAGLALDVAPPASHLVGQNALVFCLVGYGCGKLRGPLEQAAWLPLAGVALGVAGAEALYALVGVTFGDPDVTWAAVRQVLPVATAYELVLSPFVLYLVVWLQRVAGEGLRAAPGSLITGGELAAASAGSFGRSGIMTGAVRDTRSGREPKIAAFSGGQSALAKPGPGLGRPRSPRGAAFSGGQSALSHAGRRLARVRSPRGAAFSGGQSAFTKPGPTLWRARSPRGGTFSGGHSALTPPAPRPRPRPARLKLGRRRGGVVGGGVLSGARLGGKATQRKTPGRGTFTGSGSGSPRTGLRALLPRGRRRSAAPKFRASRSLRPGNRGLRKWLGRRRGHPRMGGMR